MEGVMTWEVLAYFMSLVGAKYFSDLGSMLIPYNTISDDKILQKDKWVIGVSKESPELSGGVKTGSTVMNLSYDEDNTRYVAQQTGTVFMASAKDVVKCILNGLGVNVTGTSEVVNKISSALSLAFATSITASTLNEYSIPVLLKNGVTYLAENIVKAISNALYDLNIFKSEQKVVSTYPSTGTHTISAISINTGMVTTLCNIALDFCTRNYGIWESNYYNTVKDFTENYASRVVSDFISLLADSSINPQGYSLTNSIQALSMGLSSSSHVITRISFSLDMSKNYSTGTPFDTYVGSYEQYSGVYVNGIDCRYANSSFILDYNVGSFDNPIKSRSPFVDSYNFKIFFNKPTYPYSVLSSNPYLSTLSLQIEDKPLVDGIDFQIGGTTPATNDIDIDTTYPEWGQHAIDVGWYDTETATLTSGRALPIDVSNLGVIGDAGEFTIDQATAQTGVLDVSDVRTKSTVVEDATLTIPSLIDKEGERVNVDDIPDVAPTDTPTPVIPFGGGNTAGLATIYNPTDEEVSQLRSTLWEQTIVDQLSRFFTNNPTDAIISLHRVYCTPVSQTNLTPMKLGYVATTISPKVVTNQFSEIECGTVDVPEIYGNATDYEPYTKVSIYLPFIGIKDLSSKDVVGGKLKVKYIIDVVTGTCIAQLFVTKYGSTQMLYTFDGNCSVEIPLTGSDHSRMVMGLIQAGLSMTAGQAAYSSGTNHHPMARVSYYSRALQTGASTMLNSVDVNRSGSLSSNAGVMNIKTPYLIINRMLPYNASNYNELYGFPSNERVLLSTLSGYTRVSDVHVENMACTDSEKKEIETLLTEGVFL